jgi:ABC-type transport system involved in multi-copper enzyme maturation permease subunit
MKQFLAFVRKEFYHVFRDSKTLLMLFGLPVAQITLFGFALTNEIKNAQIVICDYANDPASRSIIDKLEASKTFQIDKVIYSHEQIENAFKAGSIKMVIVFPANFNNDLLQQNKAQLQIIADASDPNTASTLTNYVSNIVMDYQRTLLPSAFVPLQIIPEVRMLYNPELKGSTNFVPGVMALVLMLVCVLMTSVSIVKEKEKGTMEILLVSPLFFIITDQPERNPFVKRLFARYAIKWQYCFIVCGEWFAYPHLAFSRATYFQQHQFPAVGNAHLSYGNDDSHYDVHRLYVSYREYAFTIAGHFQYRSFQVVLYHC